MEASLLPDVIKHLLRFFEPALGLHLPTFGMSIRVQAFSICSSDGDRQPFRSTLIQSHSAEYRVRTVTRLRGFGGLKIALKTFLCGPKAIRLPSRLSQVGFKLLDSIQEQQTL
jgi:hypothetical protein